jgi:GWxTD domain-containing protein
MTSRSARPYALALRLAAALALAACARPVSELREGAVSLRGGPATLGDPATVYARAGLLSSAEPIPFTGWTRFLAGPTADSTLALVALSFPARAFAFVHDGDAYRARYDVTVEFRRDGETVHRAQADETVRVSSFRETTRDEESVIFQQFAVVPPGAYTVLVAVRDSNSGRESTAAMRVSAPRFDTVASAAPIPVYPATPRRTRDERPRLVANARATAVLARDSTLRLYVERYERAGEPLRLRVRDDAVPRVIEPLRTDSAAGTSMLGEVVEVALAKLDVGLSRLEVLGEASPSGATVAGGTAVLVGLGEGLVVGSFEEVLDLLRWFAPPERLRVLQSTPAAARPEAWSSFLRETDTSPETRAHEALRDYLARLEQANARFREGAIAGWRTDRGMVFAALGEPDRVSDPERGDAGRRAQVWEYETRRVRLTFVDRSSLGEWRLTAESESDFREAMRPRDR